MTGLISWAAVAFTKKTGIDVQTQYRESLHRAAMTGVSATLARLGVAAGNVSIDVHNQVVADAVRWMESSVPEAITKLGITPDKLATLAASKISILAHGQAAPTGPTLTAGAAVS